MERIGQCFRVKPGRGDEYRRRHAEVWPALEAEFRAAGVGTYSIFLWDDIIFSYIEVEDYRAMVRTIAFSEVAAQWERAFSDLVEYPVIDAETGWPPALTHVWSLPSVNAPPLGTT